MEILFFILDLAMFPFVARIWLTLRCGREWLIEARSYDQYGLYEVGTMFNHFASERFIIMANIRNKYIFSQKKALDIHTHTHTHTHTYIYIYSLYSLWLQQFILFVQVSRALTLPDQYVIDYRDAKLLLFSFLLKLATFVPISVGNGADTLSLSPARTNLCTWRKFEDS